MHKMKGDNEHITYYVAVIGISELTTHNLEDLRI